MNQFCAYYCAQEVDCFFDFRGMVQLKFLPHGQTASKDYYLSVMSRLREAIWFLHHDIASGTNLLVLVTISLKLRRVSLDLESNRLVSM